MNSAIRAAALRLLCLGLIGVFLALAPAQAQAQAQDTVGPGRVVGKVIDQLNALTLPGVPIEVVGTAWEAFTDLDGKYSIELPPGDYELKVTMPGYHERVVQGVSVTSGQVSQVDVVLDLDALEFSEEVTVTAEVDSLTSNETVQLLVRRRSGLISDNLGAEEMKKNSDSDAASAMARVTGLSVVDDQYVFVRGLGERYSNTTLNGAVLPTTEPDKRVVSLDLFPASLVDSVQVIKSYLPDQPADFAGGLVQIEPVNFPTELTLSASLSYGGNSHTLFKDVAGYPGGRTDWLGYDDGTRALPGGIPDERVRIAGIFGGGYTPEQVQAFGRSFANVWEPRDATGRGDSSLSFLVGNSWNKLGAVFSLTYRNRSHFRQEQQTFYRVGAGENLEVQNDYDFDISTKKATLAAVGNVSYLISPNHKLALENFYSNNSTDETRTFEGFNDDIRSDIRDARLYWIEEGIFSSKLSGEHFLPSLAASRIDWHVAFSKAKRDEPDLREVLYEFRSFTGEFTLADESQSGFRMFNELDDRIYQADGHWSLFFSQWQKLPASVKFGPAFLHRERDFASRRFRFAPYRTQEVDLTAPPEQIFAPENIGTAFQLNEETRATDAYTAGQDILAGYAMVDLPLAERLRLVGGARIERSEQTVDTFDPLNPNADLIRSALDSTDVLPGLNLVYQVSLDMNLRAAYSHTVNRPEFRELAPFEFTDVVGGRAVVGNPDLKRALIRNADLRWEWFPGPTEVLAVSLFYKDFDDPIERIVQPTAQLRTSYANALGAKNKGIEVEGRKEFGAHFFAGFNYTFVDSEIELEQGAGRVQTSASRPLAGQSEHLVNGTFEVRNAPRTTTARLLVNYFGDRISDVGALGLPDILEEGRTTLDFVLSQRFGQLSAKLSAENLLDSERRFTQGGLPQRLYKDGRSFSIGLSYAR